MKSHITAENLAKTYRNEKEKIPALENVSLTVKENEFVSVIGSTGCGKTTFLKIVGGLLEPTSGNILIGGYPPLVALKHHKIGFVFQESSLLPWRTAYENIRLATEIRGINNGDGKIIEEIMDLVGLTKYSHLLPAQLSGGMRACVSIARTFSITPSVLLMDEQFSNLDEITRKKMNELLLRLCIGRNITSIFVTHNISDAVFLSDRVVILTKRPAAIKKIIEVGFSRPRTNDLRFENKFSEKVREVYEILAEANRE